MWTFYEISYCTFFCVYCTLVFGFVYIMLYAYLVMLWKLWWILNLFVSSQFVLNLYDCTNCTFWKVFWWVIQTSSSSALSFPNWDWSSLNSHQTILFVVNHSQLHSSPPHIIYLCLLTPISVFLGLPMYLFPLNSDRTFKWCCWQIFLSVCPIHCQHHFLAFWFIGMSNSLWEQWQTTKQKID